MQRLIARHPVASFITIAFVFSYTVGFATLWIAGAWIRPISEMAANYLGRAGVVFGPAFAALIVTRATSGREGVIRLLLRLRVPRADIVWIGVIPIATLAVTMVAFVATGTAWTALVSELALGWHLLLAQFVIQLFIVGIGEELGWRGWLLPTLLGRRSRLVATLLVASIWYVWHGPKLLMGPSAAAALALTSFGLSVLFTVLWTYTGGSVAVVAVAHAAANIHILFFENNLGYERALSGWMMASALYASIAVALLVTRWSWWRTGAPRASEAPETVADIR